MDLEMVDYFVFHQANEFILGHLAKKIGIEKSKFITAMKNFGNTSSASIPLTMCDKLHSDFNRQKKNILLAGFGVGLSWSAITCEFNNVTILPVIEI
jgi:3-oxoacyl-[acyl-carrier-protein] synthase-3